MKIRKRIALLLSFLLIFSIAMGNAMVETKAAATETITVTVSEGAELLDTFGDYIKVDGLTVPGGSGNSVTVNQAATHTIGFLCAFGYSIDRAVVNGTEAAVTPDEFGAWYYCEVADASSYDIKLSAGGNSVYTIAWDNEGTLGTDAVVAHGKVEIVPAEGITDMTEDPAKGGHYAVDPGTIVTIKLIPDYGYQLKSTDLNGATVAAGSEVSTFTFEMPSTNLHLAALFEQTPDQVDCTASDVVSNVSIGNGGNAASSGNLRMTVADNNAYTTDVSSAVNGSSVATVASVDLTLDNIVSQGNNEYWTSNVTEFANPISVGLQLDAEALSAGETYSVVRDHDGTLTELSATYDAATGTLTFDTNQFSTYTIVKKTVSQNTSEETQPAEENTNTENNESDASTSTPTDTSNSTPTDTSNSTPTSTSINTTTSVSNTTQEELISPETGENDTAGIWFMLAVISAVGAVYFAKSKKIA